MTIWLVEASTYREPLDSWPLPPERTLMASREADRFREDLARYVSGDVRGRSYLIAGHRGVGKTSLSIHAVELLFEEIMRKSMTVADELPGGPLQRPLLVKLEGPSMLGEQRALPVASPAPGTERDPAQPADGGADGAEEAATERPEKAEETGEPPSAVEERNAHLALTQITIGLYRALANEAATGYRAHSVERRTFPPTGKMERAAQLALDLDGGAEVQRLREYWAGIGRLENGVFWPMSADLSFPAHHMYDQGLREITALATAAQAFQVCTGRISYSTSATDALDRVQKVETSGSSNLAEGLKRLATLGLGALTGVSILGATGGSAAASIGGGLAVWLLGTLAVTWSDKRTRTNNKSVAYSFIRDSSLATLGRDLPVVIARVREAGLVPVFVIDELDKVEDAPQALRGLIGKLKHLIADYGFFCFLVNRDCYEAIEDRIRRLSYPPEHTLFGERILLRPDPANMLAYLLKLVKGEKDDPISGQARTAFALVAMHEAQLNLTDLTRYLGRFPRGRSEPFAQSSDYVMRRKLIVGSVQLAIHVTLRGEQLAERMAEDPIFAQLAIDTLYYPSRQWKAGETMIKSSREDLEKHLVERMRQELADPASANPGKPHEAAFPLGSEDMNRLHAALVEMLRLLTNMQLLRETLGERMAVDGKDDGEEPQPGVARLADIIPPEVSAICVETKGKFSFCYQRNGDAIGSAIGVLTEEMRAQYMELAGYAREFAAIVKACGTSIDELVKTPLLNNLTDGSVDAAATTLEVALLAGQADSSVPESVSTLEGLVHEVGAGGAAIAHFLVLADTVRRDAKSEWPVVPRISRLIRFKISPQNWFTGHDAREIAPLGRTLADLRTWNSNRKSYRYPVRSWSIDDPHDAYFGLLPNLRSFFVQRSRAPALIPHYSRLIEAAADRVPGAALCAEMKDMTGRDWSRLALAAYPARTGASGPAPYWMLVAGLRGLGFGRDALLRLATPDEVERQDLARSGWTIVSPTMGVERCFEIAREMAESATGHRSGMVATVGPGDNFAAGRSSVRFPTLVIDKDEFEDYFPLVAWLDALGILELRATGPGEAASE